MYDLNMNLFLISVEEKIKILMNETGFEDLKLTSQNTDTTKNCTVFSYKGTQVDAEWSVFACVDFANYKNNSDFSDILVTGYILHDSLDIFHESCYDLKAPYCKLLSQLEHEILSTSLDIDSICSKNKKRI